MDSISSYSRSVECLWAGGTLSCNTNPKMEVDPVRNEASDKAITSMRCLTLFKASMQIPFLTNKNYIERWSESEEYRKWFGGFPCGPTMTIAPDLIRCSPKPPPRQRIRKAQSGPSRSKGSTSNVGQWSP